MRADWLVDNSLILLDTYDDLNILPISSITHSSLSHYIYTLYGTASDNNIVQYVANNAIACRSQDLFVCLNPLLRRRNNSAIFYIHGVISNVSYNISAHNVIELEYEIIADQLICVTA